MPTATTSERFLERNALLIGAPLLDLIYSVGENFIHSLSGKKGGMEIINDDEYRLLLLKAGTPEIQSLGGSAVNVAKVMAQLGTKSSFAGKLGKDQAGEFFADSLKKMQIRSFCTFTEKPTGHVFCFVTPDTLRTCRSYLGASEEFHISDIHSDYFKKQSILHLEGYNLLKPGLTEYAIQLAKKNGNLVSFDLGSFEIVKHHLSLIEKLLPQIDILFGNEEEAHALTHANAEESCSILKELVKIAIVFQGKNGCMIGETGKNALQIPAFKVKAKDTTGAGDFFAGAFLDAFLRNCPIEKCAELGAYCAAEVVQIFGTDLPETAWQKIKNRCLS